MMKKQTDKMRKANFKIAYIQNMNTEESTYKRLISDNANEGRDCISATLPKKNLKNLSSGIGQ